MNRVPLLALLVLSCALCPGLAQAQTVVNPKTVEFDPSADHATLTADGQPVVQRYDLQIFAAGAVQPITAADLGKPAPQADGKIRVDFSTLVVGWPLADGTYQARVAAVGATGIASSDPSNSFAFQSCGISLGSSGQAVGAGGATGGVTVTAPAGCAWTATSNASWVTLQTAGGTGSGTVGFTVSPNLDASLRTATLTIGGQGFTITQAAAASCSYALSAASQAFGQGGGNGSVALTCGSSCAWAASSSVVWVAFGATGGAGPGTVSYTVAKNITTTSRTATVTIGGLAYRIDQAAANRPSSPKKVRIVRAP